MRTSIRLLQSALLLMIAGALVGCPYSVVVIRDVTVKGDSWSMDLDYMKDGPEGFTTGGSPATYHTPAIGDRFFWARIKLRNEAATARAFNFDRCDLDLADRGVVPTLVSTAPMVFEANRVEMVSAGDSIDRFLVFAYPMSATPTRLACAPMVFRLPPIAPR